MIAHRVAFLNYLNAIFLCSFVGILCLSLNVSAQDTTKVELDLTKLETKAIEVKVYPPNENSTWEFVIPEIIPGTYMKVNYIRFYEDFQAFDIHGEKLKIKTAKNVLTIKGEEPLSYLTYAVKPSHGAKNMFDNIVACGGSVYTEESALINFQMINGYFEGYQNSPFAIEVKKPENFYGASSIDKKAIHAEKDLLIASNYDALIDEPILYAEPDTVSFQVANQRFIIAVYAEAKNRTAKLMLPTFKELMLEIDSLSGLLTSKDYYFLLYFMNEDHLKGMFKWYGIGSALEHKNSSVYFDLDDIWDSTFSYYYNIGAHEYFHTLTPLNLQSEKIANFNFREADMSQNVWFYEGFTDYLAMLLLEQLNGKKSKSHFTMRYATMNALDRKNQSMTESGEHIIRKKNAVSWLNKIFDLGNFYEKGKLIAFALDMELIERYHGKRRVLDMMLEMRDHEEDKCFTDTQLLAVMEKYTYPGFEEEFSPYIAGTEMPPFEEYFEKIGWTYYPEKSEMPSYGVFTIFEDRRNKRYYIPWAKKNAIGFEKKDTLISVNGIPIYDFMDSEAQKDSIIKYPKIEDTIEVIVKRNSEILALNGQPKLEKTKSLKLRANLSPTREQQALRNLLFYRKPND
jgi:predicted metalloprotease with PDZ domain